MKRLIADFGRRALAFWARAPRPTLPGVVFLAVTAVVTMAGVVFPGPALLFVAGLLMAAAIASVTLPILNLAGVTVERLPLRGVYAGESFEVTLLLFRSGRSKSYSVVVEDGIDGPYARPGHAIALEVGTEPVAVRTRVKIRERGLHEVRTVRLSTRFPFGLFELRIRRELLSEIVVYPRIGVFRHEPVPFRAFSRVMTASETVREKGQEEFRNLREYRRGDNPRLIAWRATAHRRELMVKELEDDLTKRVTVFLESRLPERPDSRDRLRLERAVSFTATLIKELARRRYHVTLRALTPAPSTVSAGRGGRRLARVMEKLAVLEPARDAKLEALIRLAPPETFVMSLPIVVVPTLDPKESARAFRTLPARRQPLVFRADGAWERSLFGYADVGEAH